MTWIMDRIEAVGERPSSVDFEPSFDDLLHGETPEPEPLISEATPRARHRLQSR